MERITKENLIKNIILTGLFVLLYPSIQNYLVNSNLATDKASSGDILVAVSIFAVIACFGAFAFTYEKIKLKNTMQRFMAHLTTGLLMFVIGVSLIFTSMLVSFIMGHFFLIDLILVILYLGVVGYDFWDVQRIVVKA